MRGDSADTARAPPSSYRFRGELMTRSFTIRHAAVLAVAASVSLLTACDKTGLKDAPVNIESSEVQSGLSEYTTVSLTVDSSTLTERERQIIAVMAETQADSEVWD